MLQPDLTAAVKALRGRDVTVMEARTVGGGCINEARVLYLSDGSRFFLKSNEADRLAMFEAERRGLETLRAAAAEAGGGLVVPRPLAVSSAGGRSWLLVECLESAPPRGDFFSSFGRGLALLHRCATERRAGFAEDNFIGSTPQSNGWTDSWVDFFRRRRLAFQMSMALTNGRLDPACAARGERLLADLERHLPEPRRMSLLHGDLWGGNYMSLADGRAALIDPAVYYGHHEADLAMSELFGGFPQAFYRAYAEVLPIDADYAERRDIYNLYHLLNHLNLFGASYAAQVRAILKRF